ncbi:MAG: hypothetical protein EOP42_02405 [Sphingobacteriaceae bacterium]|nr:MAG: hypothetical protein EOP42_02405 [Sphingobacteriaceae bacterium]
MNELNEHNDWLNEFPLLQKTGKGNPFQVPDLFFEEQQENIISAIFAEKLKQELPDNGFIVPENYFENLQEQLISAVKLEEMRPPAEASIKSSEFFEEQQNIIAARIKINQFAENGEGFTVPANYFETLSDRINQKTGIKTVQQPAKIKTLFTKAAWKYATAACIAVAVVTGFGVKQYQAAHNIQNRLSDLPDADIENYLDIHADSYDNHIILETTAADNGLTVDKNRSADSNSTLKK